MSASKATARKQNKKLDNRAFEFGPMSPYDRFRINRSLLRQGKPLHSQTIPDDVLVIDGHPANVRIPAEQVFGFVKSIFSNSDALKLLNSSPIIGVMSDRMSANGRAGILGGLWPKHFINVTVGSLLQGLVSLHRLYGHQGLQLLGPEFSRTATSRYYENKPFQIAINRNITQQVVLGASYGMLAVFSHELAHVLRGHTFFSKKHMSEKRIDEVVPAPISKGNSVRRVMEFDADDYAGKFLAGFLFRDFMEARNLLESEDGMRRFLFVAAGVSSLFLTFGARTTDYYSGPIRAYVVLGSLLKSCSKDPGAVRWLDEQLGEMTADMIAAETIRPEEAVLRLDEMQEILEKVIPDRTRMENDWVSLRPWGR
ncbi:MULTISPECIES: hypothetical protein [unclassified Luteibacter]|uniref:hypothetical protein n=1 Tax=Luteibacter sp. PvP019 TaxID=3156436 RepID=UPI003392B626